MKRQYDIQTTQGATQDQCEIYVMTDNDTFLHDSLAYEFVVWKLA